MPRVPVPEDEYDELDRVSVAGVRDHHYGQADVNVGHIDHGPMALRVDRDDDGLYVGCSPAYADDVAAFLGATVQAESESEPDAPDGPTGTLPFNPDAHPVREIEDRVGDIDDAEALRALRNLERDGQGRTTAIDAIEARLNAVTDDT